MKFLVLLGDGMADFPLPQLNGQTPLAAANTPAMDELARHGLCALFSPIPEGYQAGSDIGNLSCFGYNPDETFTGRAPLEAANQGIELGPSTLAFRCNLVTLNNGKMADFTAGHISSEEAADLIHHLNDHLGDANTAFHPGVSYRHLATIAAKPQQLEELAALKCTPPHDITNKSYDPYLPQGPGRAPILQYMEISRDLLKDHSVNKKRLGAGKPPANSIWLWGQGKAPRMTTYRERFGIDGAVISAVDLVNGIGRCAGFEVIRVPGATGYLDTNYEGKVAAAKDALNRVDFVYLHVEAPDEASHEGSVEKKLQALEDFDARVVRPCLDYAQSLGNCRVLVAPDHITSIESRTHAGGPVPFALFGPGIVPNAASAFNEAEAAKFGERFPRGYQLTMEMIQSPEIR